uniref:Microtubule-associated protein n=1 Tax=Gouania willdenowi TaxID=441366 RepID=A0A8C5HE40_GOUWI
MKHEAAGGKAQMASKKIDFSHVTSRLGSKDNMKQVAGGGNVQILNKKVDMMKVASKCGSKDNIKHKPGEMREHRMNIKGKTQTKVDPVPSVKVRTSQNNRKSGQVLLFDRYVDISGIWTSLLSSSLCFTQ